MEGRRRRAQRLTQNIEEQSEHGTNQPEIEPDDSLEPSVKREVPEAEGERRRRRPAQNVYTEQEPAAKPVNAIPRMPKLDEEEPAAQANSPKAEAKNKQRKQPARVSLAKALSDERVRQAAGRSARVGKEALKGIGGLILLVMMMAGEGIRKLGLYAGKLMNAAKGTYKKHAGSKASAPMEEYELEMIRPQDYHGRGQMHAEKEAANANKPVSDMLRNLSEMGKKAAQGFAGKGGDRAMMLNRLLSALLVCVALYSAWQIGAIVIRSVRTNRLNASLSEQRAAIIQEQMKETEQQEDEHTPAVVLDEATAEPTAAPTQEPTQETQPVQPAATPAPDIVKTTKYRQVGGDALPEMADLYAKNRDLVAWIQIPDVLDLPVVYRDNSYYLTRDFNKQKNAAGTIFLDVNHPFKEKTQNLLLHGHNMKDGTMFGRLAQYLHDDTYIRNHPFIYFDTLWHKEQYVIVAMLNVSLNPGDTRFFNYFTHDTFSSDREFEMYIRQLQLRSYYAIPIDVKPSDALLTLSTCLDEDRLVIVARRLRENETRSELRTLIRMTTKQ